MQTANSSRCGIWLGLTVWLVWGVLCSVWAASSATNSPAVHPASTNPPHAIAGPRPLFSTGIGDIVNMARAGLDADVIRAFIEQSRVSYRPSAQEIVFLKNLGVANDILIMLLTHPPRPAQNPRLSPAMRPWSEPQLPEQRPAEPRLPWYAIAPRYPINPYAWLPPFAPYLPTYTGFGPLVSFNNSYPTFVNGQAVYTGYYVPAYGVLW